MIVRFNNTYLEKIFTGKEVSGKPRYSAGVVLKFKKTVLMIQHASSIKELRKFRGLNFEALKGDYKGFYSVRVDLQYRLILSVETGTVIVSDVVTIEDLTNHYR